MLDGEAGIEPRRPFTECGRLRANRSWHAIHNTINLQMVSMVSNGPKAQVALQGIECVTGCVIATAVVLFSNHWGSWYAVTQSEPLVLSNKEKEASGRVV
jgi:hypothetical protein